MRKSRIIAAPKTPENMKSYNVSKTDNVAPKCTSEERPGDRAKSAGGVCEATNKMRGSGPGGLSVYTLMTISVLLVAIVAIHGVTSFAVDIPRRGDQDTILFEDNEGEDFDKRSSAMHFYKRAAFPAGDLRRSSPWHYGKRSSAMHFYKKTPSVFAAVPADDSFSSFY